MMEAIKRLPDHDAFRKWAAVVAAVVFSVSTIWNVATIINVQSSNTATLDEVIDVGERACQNRHALTVQYQVRGRNQRAMARAQLLTVEAFLSALAESPPPPPGTTQKELDIRAKFIHRYRATVPKLEHILQTTKTLPAENCKKQAEELRAGLPPG